MTRCSPDVELFVDEKLSDDVKLLVDVKISLDVELYFDAELSVVKPSLDVELSLTWKIQLT